MKSAQQPSAFYLPIGQPRTIPVFAGARRSADVLPGSRAPALGRGRHDEPGGG